MLRAPSSGPCSAIGIEAMPLVNPYGGKPAQATEELVKLLRANFDDTRFVVPHSAMSAATERSWPSTEDRKKRARRNYEVPLEEHLTAMVLLIFALPAYLDQRHDKKGISITGSVTVQVGGPPAEELLKKHGASSLVLGVSYQPIAFARLLAKIAYGFAVAWLGLSMIEEDYVLPAILGKSDDVGHWVGCVTDNQLAAGKHLHEIKLLVTKGEIIERVRLFARFNALEYLVAVGRVSSGFVPIMVDTILA